MRFGVLGPLAVWTGAGEPVAIPGAKVRALLADLLVHAGEVLSADRLVDDLWGDRLPRDPINALQAKVSQLRRALDGAEPGARGLVVSRPPGYLLDAGAGTVDASQFDLLVARARDIAAGEPEGSGKLLREALALWRGGALGEFMDAPFARHAIARLESSRIAALEDLIESRLSAGEGSGITAELEALVAEHPLRERLRGQHMRALYRAGRQAEALDSYHQLRERLADELGLDPSPGLGRLYRAILAHDPDLETPTPAAAPTGARPLTNLPSPVSSLVGREAEVAEPRAVLRDQRLVTLTGPGGVGKTRVALETASRMAEDHARRRLDLPDGVWVVELGGPRDHRGHDSLMCLAELVAAALGVRDDAVSAAATTDRLAAALRTKRLLLVLDNCEHVVAPAAALADLLLRSAPGLRILATSREPLSLAGELLRPVPPLDVPPTAGDAETVGRSAAVQLFIGRAAAVRPGFALDAGNAAAIATICARLDGLPLAIELAAARVRVLDVHDLAARLDDRFEALGAGPRNAPPRQRTLRAMIDWSFQLLPDPERAVLRRLAVHAGGFTLAAAEAVCATGGVEASDVLDLVAALVDRSMVTVSEGGARYLLLETIRAYALERLDEEGETATTRRRHARFFSELASGADRHLRGPGQRRWLERLDAEAANLRAALDWTIEERDAGLALRLAGVLGWYWYLRGRQAEGRRFFTAALAIDGAQASPERANALAWRCALGAMQPATDWIPHGRDALARYAQLEDPAGLAHAQLLLGGLLWTRGALPEYARLAGEALAAYRRLGDRWGLAAALSVHGWVALERGELGVARREGVESRTLFGDLGDAWGLCRAAELLGLVAEIDGEYEHATGEHRTALRLAADLGLHTVVAHELGRLGRLAALAAPLSASPPSPPPSATAPRGAWTPPRTRRPASASGVARLTLRVCRPARLYNDQPTYRTRFSAEVDNRPNGHLGVRTQPCGGSRLRAMSGGDEYLHPEPYNPLSEVNLARAIREELERQPSHQLPPQAFWGAGLYALYYVGDLALYEGLNDSACVTPIYIGKAAAGRRSFGAFIKGSKTRKLLNRIHDHVRSIEEAHTNLSLMDFRVRYLVTSDVHIVLGEAGLLQAYAPVLWNTVVTGFGINQPGAGRTGQRKSRWDTLHPGRPRAEGREPNAKSVEELTAMVRLAIEARLKGESIPADVVADEIDLDTEADQEEI